MRTQSRSVRRPSSLRTAGTAIGLTAAVLAGPAFAQSTEEKEVQLDTLRIEDRTADVNPNGEPGAPYKARTSGDERHSRPIAELPQTITVLTERQIEDSGYTDLARILDAQPGITVGTGENGNAFGDRYVIRGQEARSDVFVDGLRDPGMTTRESFAVDQIEVSKGPSSSFAGRGTAGGAVNAISKQATTDYGFTKASIGAGSDQFVRLTADANMVLSDVVAMRVNVLYGKTDIPGRSPTDRERKGLAVSTTYTPSDQLDLTLDYYGLRADDNPDIGDYLSGDVATTGRFPVKTPVYAQSQDFQSSNVNVFTGRLRYQFSDTVRITNQMRYGLSDNGYVVTGARGATTHSTNPGGAYTTASVSTHQGWQDVSYFANQTNLFVDTTLFGLENDLIFGLEYTDHQVVNGNYTVTNTGPTNCILAGNTGTASPGYCILTAAGAPVANINNLLGRSIAKTHWDQDWQMKTLSAYVMDTVDLTPKLTAFGGIRFDKFDFELGLQSSTLVLSGYGYDDSLVNGHFGLTYKISDHGMVYGSVASAADVNCGESDVGTNAGYGGCIVINDQIGGGKPEQSVNLELGTKFNLFDEKLLLTAAVFQTTKDDVFEASGGGYTATGTGNTGENRVRGIELGFAGNISPDWSMQGGLTVMESEVLKSAANPLNVGKMVANFAEVQGSFQTRYQLTEQLAFGLAAKHKGKRYGGQPDTAAAFTTLTSGGFVYSQPTPAYTVADIFAEYRLNQNLDFRLNVNNVTDEDYYLAVYRSGSFLYKGDARQVVGTLNLRF